MVVIKILRPVSVLSKSLVAVTIVGCLGTAVFRLMAEPRQLAPKNLPPGVKAVEASGLHNLFALGTNIFSGSSPEGEAGFASLETLGVKTIITVDGATPDVETARKHGFRYVHLPHGYNGISTNLLLRLAKAAEALPGPIYVHCHHGQHRGPAAAAILCMTREGWDSALAESWLVAAGTATNYTGLYEVVRAFRRPNVEQLRLVPSEFPETAKASGLVEAMVDIDDRWDHLKRVRSASYEAPKEHPDIKPANEALILWEHYREAQRLSESAQHGRDFIERLKAAETEAKEAERLLRVFAIKPQSEIRVELDQTFDAMAKTCSSCHKSFRDAAGMKSRQ